MISSSLPQSGQASNSFSIAFSGIWTSASQASTTAAKTVPADPGHYTVDMHGNPNNVFVGNNALTPNDLADLLENDPNWNQACSSQNGFVCSYRFKNMSFKEQYYDSK